MLRYATRGAIAIAAAYVAAVGFQLWSINGDLSRAEAGASDLSLDALADADDIRDVVEPLLDGIRQAEDTADSPLLGAMTWVPVVGDQVDGLRALTDRLSDIAATADTSLGHVESALDATGDRGGKVALTAAAIDAVRTIRSEIASTPPLRADDLLPPLRGASARLDAKLTDADADLAQLEHRLEVANEVLIGPTRILLLAANNAEIKAGMGMHLSVGVVTIDDGEFETSRFSPTDPLVDATEGRAAVPRELSQMYRRIWDFGREWRTTSTSANFPVVGEIFTDLARRTTFGHVDLVLSVDSPALAELLDATGPVDVEGRTITSDNAVDLLLRDNYLELGDPRQTDERRELQSEVATAIFDAFTDRDVDVIELATGISSAAEGRHVLGYSADADIQALFEALGADGSLSDHTMLVSFQNATASKRDYYTDTDVRVDPIVEFEDGSRRYRATATLENPVVDPTAPYVDSLNRFVPVGIHRTFVTFNLPGATTDIVVVDGDLSSTGTDGPTVVANLWLRVPEGESGSVTIDFTLPGDVRTVDVLPSARIRPTVYEFGPVTITDEVPRTVRLPRVVVIGRPHEPKLVEAAVLVVLFASLVVWVNRSRRLSAPEPDLAAARADAQVAVLLVVIAVGLAVLGLLS